MVTIIINKNKNFPSFFPFYNETTTTTRTTFVFIVSFLLVAIKEPPNESYINIIFNLPFFPFFTIVGSSSFSHLNYRTVTVRLPLSHSSLTSALRATSNLLIFFLIVRGYSGGPKHLRTEAANTITTTGERLLFGCTREKDITGLYGGFLLDVRVDR